MLRYLTRPVRKVLRWQLAVAVGLTLAGWLVAGSNGALSAAAGGTIGIVACLVSAIVASASSSKSAGGVLAGALRAEATKIGLAVLLLWLVLANYPEAVVLAVVGAFVATMLVFSMAFFVREY